MKKITVIGATVLLAASSTVTFAGSKGATTFSPGHLMQGQTTPTTKGASQLTPGEQLRDLRGTTTNGASDFTPGDKKNDLAPPKK
jgi:hypothetical protein